MRKTVEEVDIYSSSQVIENHDLRIGRGKKLIY